MAKMTVNLQVCILPDCAGVIDDNICIFFSGYFCIAHTFHDTGHCIRLQGIHLAACILDKEAGAFSYFSFTSSVHLLIYSNCILLSCVLLFTIDSSSFCLQHFGALFLSYRIYGFMSNANLCFYYFLFSDTVFL